MLRLLGAIRVLMLLSFGLTTHASQITPHTSQSGHLPVGGKRALPPIPTQQSPVIVLSIDGAAVRGIAQFELLLAIEQKVNERLAKEAQAASGGKTFKYERMSITDMFDFFAGTSAGSVNVGALLVPADYTLSNTLGHQNKAKFTLEELKARLPETLKAAFSSSTFRKVRTLQVPGVGGLLGSKFTAGPFEELLQEIGGKARVSDFVKPAVITSYDLRARDIMNFATYDACTIKKGEDVVKFQPQSDRDFHRTDKNVFIWQAVRASSAAPVFYKPLELEIGGKPRALIDAGLFIMSPTLLAWIEAQKIYPRRPLIVISISSGALMEARDVQTKGSTAGSIPKVLQPTIETALEGQQALTDLMMRDLPNIKYHRLSFEVKNKDFDDTSEKNIKQLEEAAKVTIASLDFKNALDDIVSAILERREKMKKDPRDFAPFVCEAKAEFVKNMDLRLSHKGPSSDEKKQKISDALKKMETASAQMGKPDEHGKRMVEFGAKDTELQKTAAKAKEDCQLLLGQREMQAPGWREKNCNNVLGPKEICNGLTLEKATLESDLSNNGCKKVSLKKPKVCETLSGKMKKNSQELKSRNCKKVMGS